MLFHVIILFKRSDVFVTVAHNSAVEPDTKFLQFSNHNARDLAINISVWFLRSLLRNGFSSAYDCSHQASTARHLRGASSKTFPHAFRRCGMMATTFLTALRQCGTPAKTLAMGIPRRRKRVENVFVAAPPRRNGGDGVSGYAPPRRNVGEGVSAHAPPARNRSGTMVHSFRAGFQVSSAPFSSRRLRFRMRGNNRSARLPNFFWASSALCS